LLVVRCRQIKQRMTDRIRNLSFDVTDLLS